MSDYKSFGRISREINERVRPRSQAEGVFEFYNEGRRRRSLIYREYCSVEKRMLVYAPHYAIYIALFNLKKRLIYTYVLSNRKTLNICCRLKH